MTEVTPAPTTTSASLAPHQIWIRTRGLLLALLVLVAAGIALATVRSFSRRALPPVGTLVPGVRAESPGSHPRP
ncbi:hypothetical protein ABT115_18535 [Streptomyces sp. NPDC001832]|uniref:hypothetical protein n=1 Tax=Streptomyces sp. NPDC001832 TaxID=3154527 RepID=UPI00332EBFDB